MRLMDGRAFVWLLLPLVAAGCAGGREEAATSDTPAATAGEENTRVGEDEITLGRQVGPEGTIAEPTDEFRQGEPLFVSVEADSLEPGTQLKLTWYGPEGQKTSEEELVVPPDATVINVKARDTSDWASGTHRLEVWTGDTKTAEKTFTMGEAVAGARAR